ncbi:MAG: serpin family protein [Desulfurococcales archaeon]|nr:serpin family protein [Desulfurococcales archaeon]
MGAGFKQVLGVIAAVAIILALIVFVNPPGGGGVTPVKSGEVTLPQLTASINKFTVDVLRKVGAEEGGSNFVMSPMNLYVALLMLYEGTDSETAQELANALHIPPGSSVCNAYVELIGKLPVGSEGSAKLFIANGVWLREDFPFRKSYVSEVQKCFNATVKQFGSVEGLSDEINSWVSKKTEGMIKKLVGQLSKDTEAVLASAMYFKALWTDEFRYAGNMTFHTSSGDVKTHFMRVTSEFKVIKNSSYVAVELPYRNTSIAMVIVMPNDIRSFTDNLTYEGLTNLLKNLRDAKPEKVEILMPAFYVKSRYDNMVKTLKELGVKSVFSDNADFSKMAEVRRGTLTVSQVIHVAAINVTEKGTEASAATAITVVLTSVPPGSMPPLIKIDRPFMYFLVDTATGTVLFAGEVTNPAT